MAAPAKQAAASGPPLIQVHNALCRINRLAVLTIEEFSISAGEHWCLFGPNGAGKSLLAALLAGKRRESGSYVNYAENFDPGSDCFFVSFEEQQRLWEKDNRLDMSEYSERAEDKGTVVIDLIQAGRPEQADEALFDKLVEQLDLSALLEKGIRFLSSGQIRKVLIARALYACVGKKNKLVIFDEPLESIDRDSRERIERCIEQYQGKDFSSLLLCRRAQDIMAGVTHIALMQELKLVEQGKRAAVEQSTNFQSLLQRVPDIPAQVPNALSAADSGQSQSEAPLIELKKVSASYGDLLVLNEVSWEMGPKDHVLIEGPNGCGKSTLLSLIDGENHKGYGQDVYLFGQRKGTGETVWDIKARFGIVSNELHNKYVKGWKVLDVVVSGFFDSVGLYDDSGSGEWEGARSWLHTLGVSDLEKRYYHELSFGQQRLVLLARAMVKHPSILILDEPCVGLDDYYRQLILGTLNVIAQQSDTRIVYVSHVSDEEPDFATQRVRFKPAEGGGYKLEQSAL